jgi:tetraacyldisaccharide-1-P 4'-kinase
VVRPDHHAFTAADLAFVQQQVRDTGADAVLTTAKDAVRLGAPEWSVPTRVLHLDGEIEGAERLRESLLALGGGAP